MLWRYGLMQLSCCHHAEVRLRSKIHSLESRNVKGFRRADDLATDMDAFAGILPEHIEKYFAKIFANLRIDINL
jgi:hypothetical protein